MSAQRTIGVFGWVVLPLALLACEGPNSLDVGARDPNRLEGPGLSCTEKPEGRSYPIFDGHKLEESRVNENASANRARYKPFGALAGEYKRALGTIPPSLAQSGASFDDPPPRWYTEATQSGTSLNAMYAISFEACQQTLQQKPNFRAMPTEETAKKFCQSLMRRSWSQSPSPEELNGCVELATKKLDAEPQPVRRWAYACASVLTSSHFLTF